MDLCFTDFNGQYRVLDGVYDSYFDEFEHYLIFRAYASNYDGYRIFFFNGSFLDCTKDTETFTLSSPDSDFKVVSRLTSNTGWGYNLNPVLNINNNELIYASDALLPYKDTLLTYDFSLNLAPLEVSTFALKPIVEEVHQENNFVSIIFSETSSILPVLMVVIIGFIGIRKGINFLISQIKKC